MHAHDVLVLHGKADLALTHHRADLIVHLDLLTVELFQGHLAARFLAFGKRDRPIGTLTHLCLDDLVVGELGQVIASELFLYLFRNRFRELISQGSL